MSPVSMYNHCRLTVTYTTPIAMICRDFVVHVCHHHLRADEIPGLTVLHKIHLAKGSLPENLDGLIFLHDEAGWSL